MKGRNHLFLFYCVTSFWTFFLLGGLWSDYYQTWSFLSQLIIVDLIPTAFLIVLGRKMLRSMSRGGSVWTVACWMAFYFSVPFLVYDYIYLVLYQGQGWNYIIDYWYLTFFTFIPWVVFPVLASTYRPQESQP